jgi:hypothetical protein
MIQIKGMNRFDPPAAVYVAIANPSKNAKGTG